MKINITFSKDGEAVTEFNFNNHFVGIRRALAEKQDINRNYCTAEGINMIRLLIVEGTIDFNIVTFYFKDQPIKSNEFGVLDKNFYGFCDLDLLLAEKILVFAIKKRS